MIDVEALIREQLFKLDPLPATLSGDWDNVLTRVQGAPPIRSSRARRRPIRLALVAAAVTVLTITSVVTPLGAAIGHSMGDFSAWISGLPGMPASPSDQKTLEQERERGWTSFPQGTELHLLLQTETAGMTFKLFGWRDGDLLCLHLVVAGGGAGDFDHACAPIAGLQELKQPALVISADAGFGTIGTTPPPHGYLPQKASATYGIVSDEVSDVILSGDDGIGHALLGSDAFLYVADHPSVGARVRKVQAVTADRATFDLPFAVAPFGTDSNGADLTTRLAPTGPVGIDHPPTPQYGFEPGTPYNNLVRSTISNQFDIDTGEVSDDVRSIDLYLSDGTVQKITVKRSPSGNTFTSAPFARFGCPTRLVARDKNGAIIGNREDEVC